MLNRDRFHRTRDRVERVLAALLVTTYLLYAVACLTGGP